MTGSDLAISVENLSKSYLVGHESARGQGYQTLRETLVRNVRNFGRKAIDMARGRQIIQGDEIEEFWALKDVSFDVKRGEAVGIIGRNGAGKSTLLKILSRITEPTKGRIAIRGRVASLLEVGTGFHPELTGRENIFLNGAILGMTRREIKAKFDEIVHFAEVEKFLDTPVKRYSSGMYVRLAFAVAAHLEPETLVVDEVLSVGDAEFQKKCLAKMNDIGQAGRTVLFVSHNMLAVQTLCSRALLMSKGQFVADGSPQAIVAMYLRANSTSPEGQQWVDSATAPGNELVRIARVAAISSNPDSGRISIRWPFKIEVEYWASTGGASVHVLFHVHNQHGVLVFTTWSDPVVYETGKYLSACQIPENLLNDGTYFLNLFFIRDGSVDVFAVENIISFEVVDDAPRNVSWMGKEPGVIRPQFSWTTRRL
jgi:lipopolysaccharide transport system ATP-binding protein